MAVAGLTNLKYCGCRCQLAQAVQEKEALAREDKKAADALRHQVESMESARKRDQSTMQEIEAQNDSFQKQGGVRDQGLGVRD